MRTAQTLTHASRLAPLTTLTGADRATLVEWLFAKNDVAPGRVVAFTTLFVFTYALTTLAWQPLVRAFGWLLLPFAALYVAGVLWAAAAAFARRDL